MGVTRSDLFTDQQNELANWAKALGHPARIAIIQRLVAMDACVCGDLVDELGLAQPTISQHLKELKQIGLIQGKVEGTSICYCLDPEVWNKFRDAFAELFRHQPAIGNKCC